MTAARPGLILFAHGSRNADWATPFEAVAARVRAARPELPLRLAFLELMAPDLATAGAALVASGCTQIEIVPLFLGVGGHLRRDLPALVDVLHQQHPGIVFRLHGAVGETDAVIAALASAALATL
ncbi:MAG: CbiX/SirB N-terminal domain-containing protein [Rubrivivax sp.]